jgi:hypothetical protein
MLKSDIQIIEESSVVVNPPLLIHTVLTGGDTIRKTVFVGRVLTPVSDILLMPEDKLEAEADLVERRIIRLGDHTERDGR